MENCLGCLYAIYSGISVLSKSFTLDEYRKCDHPNSPFYEEHVSEKNICRLYLDEKEHFRNKELREKINKLKRKS